MNNKKRIIFLAIIILLVISSILIISYGYIAGKIEGNEIAKKFANLSQVLKIEYSDGTENITTPHDGYFLPGSTLIKTFTIKNTGNLAVEYSINLTEIVNNFVRTEDLVYEITDGTNTYNGIFPTIDTYIISKDTLEIGVSKTYTLTINYLTSDENQIVDNGKTISAKIGIDYGVTTIKKLNIYGNSIQDTLTYGEPSLTNPVEIQSLGDRTKNLFNQGTTEISSFSKGANTNARDFKEGVWYLGLTYNNYSYPSNLLDYRLENYTTMVKVNGQKLYGLAQAFKTEPNKTYIFNYETVTEGRVGFGFYDNEGNFLSFVTWRQGQTIKTPDNTYWMTVCISGLIADVEINFSNIQLVLGDTLPTYEPYGYKVPVTVSGKNLFKLDKESSKANYNSGYTVLNNGFNIIGTMNDADDSTGYINGYVNAYSSNQIEAGEYTLSYKQVCNGTLPSSVAMNLYGVDKSGTRVFSANKRATYNLNNNRYSITFTTDVVIPRFYGELKVFGMTCDITEIQIEKGTTATSYEVYLEPSNYNIYLDEPLRKVGDCDTCADYIDFENREIIRNIGQITYDGSADEAWNTYGENQTYYGYNITFKEISTNTSGITCLSNSLTGLSSYAKIWYGTSLGCFAGKLHSSATSTSIAITSTQSTLAGLKNELSISPLDINYVMSSKIEKSIDIPDIKLVHNLTNNISACDSKGVCASKIEVEYK